MLELVLFLLLGEARSAKQTAAHLIFVRRAAVDVALARRQKLCGGGDPVRAYCSIQSVIGVDRVSAPTRSDASRKCLIGKNVTGIFEAHRVIAAACALLDMCAGRLLLYEFVFRRV